MPHTALGWIKASCNESIRFCKYLKRYKKFCVSSANERLSFRRMTQDAVHALVCFTKTNVCLQEQRKQSFLTWPKKNSWLILKSSHIFLCKSSFCASNSWPVFCFVLSTVCLRSSLIVVLTLHPTSSAYHGLQKWKRGVYSIFKYGYCLTKTIPLATGGLYSPLEPCEACYIRDGCTLFDYFWTVEQKHPPMPL